MKFKCSRVIVLQYFSKQSIKGGGAKISKIIKMSINPNRMRMNAIEMFFQQNMSKVIHLDISLSHFDYM